MNFKILNGSHEVCVLNDFFAFATGGISVTGKDTEVKELEGRVG